MSRLGKNSINVPEKFNIFLDENNCNIEFNGKSEDVFIDKNLLLSIDGRIISIKPKSDIKKSDMKSVYSLWGLTRTNIYNAIYGLQKNFTVELTICGIGYKALVINN